MPRPSAPTHPLFASDPVLALLHAGVGAVGPGQRGRHVVRIQIALARLGDTLVEDGDYGPRTAAAVDRFRRFRSVRASEAEPAGHVGRRTLSALEHALAHLPDLPGPEEPAPGSLPGPDYRAMLQDGVLEATLAIGYDEKHAAHVQKLGDADRFLKDGLGFRRLHPANAPREELAAAGLRRDRMPPDLRFYGRRYRSALLGRPAYARVTLLAAHPRGWWGARRLERFRDALESEDAVLYSGHARAGTGPDFDPRDSTRGNFVLGEGYSEAYNAEVAGAREALPATDFAGWYQLFLLWGCRTEDYLRHLREVDVDGRPLTETRDLLLTSDLIRGRFGVWAPLAFLHGLLRECDADTLRALADAAQQAPVAAWHGRATADAEPPAPA